MIFKPDAKIYSYEVEREAGQDVMYLNYLGASYIPSLIDYPEIMARTIDALIESPNVSRIVFVQQRNYNHDFSQVSMLLEIAQLYTHLIKQERVMSMEKLAFDSHNLAARYNLVRNLLNLLKLDPIRCYVELKQNLFEQRLLLDKMVVNEKPSQMSFIRLLERLVAYLDDLALIKKAVPFLDS